VTILEQLEPTRINIDALDRQLASDGVQQILTVVPLSHDDAERLLEKPLGSDHAFLDHVFGEIARANLLTRVVVATNHVEALERAKAFGFSTFAYQTPTFDGPSASLEEVLRASVVYIQETSSFEPSHVLFLKATHVFRTAELLNELVKKALIEKADSVFVAKKEYRAIWALDNGRLVRKDSGFIKRSKKDPLWMGYTGLGCITKLPFILAGARLGESVAVIPVEHTLLLLDIQEPSQREIAKHLFLKRQDIGL
jgi:CMP-N-acetylneuraminic acid synthetase